MNPVDSKDKTNYHLKSNRKMRRLFFLLTVTLLLLSACSAKRNPQQEIPKIPDPTTSEFKTIEKTIVERDTIFQTKADSTFYNAWIECQNGIPILKNQTVKKTAAAKVDVAVSLDGNQLKIKATKEAEQLFAKWKEQYIKENSAKETKVPYAVEVPIYKEKELSWSEKLWIKIGKLSALIISVFILIKIPWKSLRKLLPF